MEEKSTERKDKILKYFFRDQVVTYNKNFSGILLNLAVGLIRVLLLLPTMRHFAFSIPFYIKAISDNYFNFNTFMGFVVVVQFIVEAPVCVLIMYDSLSCGWVLMSYGDFVERMKINIISEWVGLGGDIGLFAFRCMLWSVLVPFY
ncbi:hypothetical protein MHBO_001089 [Bonamia ostreae]|uniref:Uncharacterized protein n=1 Tax=Bonamia ostreae TaxID=126728 RepID=A0ABV2AIG0_9EUKA